MTAHLRRILLAAVLMFLAVSTVTAQESVPADDLPADPYAPLEPYTIEAMRARDYPAGEIEILDVLYVAPRYTRYLIAYSSDGLTITGIMQVPVGEGPFPVVILNHGYIRQPDYWSGYETWQAAEVLNNADYLTIAPDYRSWGGSDWAVSLFHGGLTVDVIHLISALGSIPQADPSRIGMWGHSMGGGITTKVLTIDDRVDAAVLYAPNSADDADLIGLWGPGCIANVRAGRRCNRGEVIPEDTDRDLFELYLDAARDDGFIQKVAPIYHLESILVPVQIHVGTRDTVVPPDWSFKTFEAMRAAGINVAIYRYEGQDHTFWSDSFSTFMGRVVTFFDRYVKNAR